MGALTRFLNRECYSIEQDARVVQIIDAKIKKLALIGKDETKHAAGALAPKASLATLFASALRFFLTLSCAAWTSGTSMSFSSASSSTRG